MKGTNNEKAWKSFMEPIDFWEGYYDDVRPGTTVYFYMGPFGPFPEGLWRGVVDQL